MNDDGPDLASAILAIDARSVGRLAGVASSQVSLDSFLLANPEDSILAIETALAEASAAGSDFAALIDDLTQWALSPPSPHGRP